jgi:NAD(P)-dependent dehydrogenase (short-subunit alcohol dehydrogenase family)
MNRLEGLTAVVTGAGQGIGRGIALALAKEGAAVALAGRTGAKVESVLGEFASFDGRGIAVECDVEDRLQIDELVARTAARFGRLDIVVNNAQSLAPNRKLVDVTVEDIETTWRSGALGSFHLMQAAFPHLKVRGGSVVNFGSNTALEGTPLFGAYAMAKEGIRALSRVAAREWGRYGIRVNVLCPFGESPSAREFNERRPEAAASILRSTPLGRIGDCEDDIGRAVVALVSPDLDYLTAATLMIDGGLTMLRA